MFKLDDNGADAHFGRSDNWLGEDTKASPHQA